MPGLEYDASITITVVRLDRVVTILMVADLPISNGQITLTWTSGPGQVFRITHSQNLNDAFPGVAASDIPASAGTSTTLTIPNLQPGAPRLFLRVERP